MLCDVVKFKDNAKIMLAKDRAGTARINACGDGGSAIGNFRQRSKKPIPQIR